MKRAEKKEMIDKYLLSRSKNGVIEGKIGDFIKDCKTTHFMITKELEALNLKVVQPSRVKDKTYEMLEDIKKTVKENPDITYRELGEKFGTSRQYMWGLCKRNNITLPRESKVPPTYEKSRKKILNMIRECNRKEELGGLYTKIKKYGVSEITYKKYANNHKNDPEIIKFESLLVRDSVTHRIKKDILNTDLRTDTQNF